MNDTGKQTRARRMGGSIAIFLPGLALLLSSVVKLAGVPGVVHTMAADGFSGGKLTLVAALEFLSAALFLFPLTRSFGLLMLSAFLGGAICTHVQMDEYTKAIGPCALLAIAWFGTWLRHPQVLWSSHLQKPAASHLVPQDRRDSWASKSA